MSTKEKSPICHLDSMSIKPPSILSMKSFCTVLIVEATAIHGFTIEEYELDPTCIKEVNLDFSLP